MHENQEVYTITLIVDGEDSKLLLSTSDMPAKEDDEASGVLYKADLPEQFEEITSKIPIFTAAMQEDGSEESITHTPEEFMDLFELDLMDIIERGEEILHTDLDDDSEAGEDEAHNKQVLGMDDSNLEEPDESLEDPYAIYKDEPASPEDALGHIDPREALDFPAEETETEDFEF